MHGSREHPAAGPVNDWLARLRFPMIAVAMAAALLAPATAHAGQASSGELFFYPCTTCHPVTMVPGPTPGTEIPSRPLPNGMTGHTIVLEGHDKLGSPADPGTACLACHDDPARNPGKLIIAGGGFVDIKGDVALVCYRCHEAKYKEFKAGTHGRHQPSCVAAGCHDPHTPQYIFGAPLIPFNDSGFQFKVLPVRQPFAPMAPPALPPAILTLAWLPYVAAVGLLIAGVLVGMIVLERPKR